MFLLSLLSLIHARPDCNEAMRMRGIMPARGAIAPTDGRIWFATVGTGEANHFTLSITQEGNSAPITGQIETSCYIHEGPLDNHCNLIFTPDVPLSPNQNYHILANATEFHQNPSVFIESDFSTNAEQASLDSAPPVITFVGYQARDVNNPDPCKWENSFQHNFFVQLPQAIAYDSMVQVYEKDTSGNNKLVHSIFVPIGEDSVEFRQVVPPGEEGEHCYVVQQEDISGNQSDFSEVLCYDPFAPIEEDTAAPQEEDTAVPQDTATEEPQEPTDTAQPPKEESSSGCSHISSPLSVVLWTLLLWVFPPKKSVHSHR